MIQNSPMGQWTDYVHHRLVGVLPTGLVCWAVVATKLMGGGHPRRILAAETKGIAERLAWLCYLGDLRVLAMVAYTLLPYVCYSLNLYCLLNIHVTWQWYLPYLLWCLLDRSPSWGGAPLQRVREASIGKLFAAYFPAAVIKARADTEFSSTSKYLFLCHPHGIWAHGVQLTFGRGSEMAGEIFKNLRIRTATLRSTMMTPFVRSVLLAHGYISVDRQSILNALSLGPGTAVAVVAGGAKEALRAEPGKHQLILRRRRGIFRIALETGAKVVPTYTFGETDCYTRIQSPYLCTILRYLGDATNYVFGFTLPGFSLVPKRVPLVTVVGEPMDSRHLAQPTEGDILALRDEYEKALKELFEEHKRRYLGDGENAQLEIVG